MDISHTLYRETEAAKTLKAHLHDLNADDEDTLRDMVEGETNLLEAISEAVRMTGEDEAAVEALDLYIEKLARRKDRYKARIATTRVAIGVALEIAELKKMETPFGTARLKQATRKVIITEEAEIPAEFWKTPEPQLDKSAIGKALKEGLVSGAQLSNGGTTVEIRRV